MDGNVQENALQMNHYLRVPRVQRKVERLTLDTDPTIYGCCGLFDLCDDNDLMSLSFAGTQKLLDAIGWRLTDVCKRRKQFITWRRPEQSEGSCTSGCVTDPCADGYGVEWGKCGIEVEDFGRYRRHSPVRDVTAPKRLCMEAPRYRLDGSMITNDREFDLRMVMEELTADFNRGIFTSTVATCGWDGLQTLINTSYADVDSSYDCSMLNSQIIDWNDNTMAGGAGITWNGNAVPATVDLVDVMLAVFRYVRDRIAMAAILSTQPMRVGDIVIVGPTFLLRCLLDLYTCWSVCPGVQYNEISGTTKEQVNALRQQLNGGMFGDGRIYLDGFEIPLLAHNWSPLIGGPSHGDLYMLTRKVGSVPLIEGELLDMRTVPATYPDGVYSYTDGGKVLTWPIQDHTCLQEYAEFRPRLWMTGPWAQVRFQDVVCQPIGPVISPDPCETSFFPETCFTAASCS